MAELLHIDLSDSLETQLDDAYRELALVEEAMATTLDLQDTLPKDYFTQDEYISISNEVHDQLVAIRNRIKSLEQEIANKNIEDEFEAEKEP